MLNLSTVHCTFSNDNKTLLEQEHNHHRYSKPLPCWGLVIARFASRRHRSPRRDSPRLLIVSQSDRSSLT